MNRVPCDGTQAAKILRLNKEKFVRNEAAGGVFEELISFEWVLETRQDLHKRKGAGGNPTLSVHEPVHRDVRGPVESVGEAKVA